MCKNKDLLKWYMKGFNDELNGTSSIASDNELENIAYKLGAIDAVAGDDVGSIDYKSDSEILQQIEKIKGYLK